MIQFRVVDGRRRGDVLGAGRFPVRIGRGKSDQLRIEEAGVWESHVEIRLSAIEGFIVKARAEAPARRNGEPFVETQLHNGDVIELGSCRLQFLLSDVVQKGLHLREALTWIGIALFAAAQGGLIWWLLNPV